MGQSTNGELWYGVVFEDGYEFPWSATPFDGDMEDWWRIEQDFDATRGYPADGWLDYQKAFDAAHPCPVELVNYCSGEYPMYGLAVRGSGFSARRGYPTRIAGLPPVNAAPLIAFCEKYDLKPEYGHCWHLSSYWG